jgi:phosphoglycolate phosphatase
MTKKLLVFDFDGTIADTLLVAVDIVNELSAEFGFPQVSPEEFVTFKHMAPGELMKLSGLSWMQLPLLIKRVHKLFKKHFKHVPPIDGMPEVLKSLHQQGFRMGILTSNSKENVEEFLKEHGLEYFEFVKSPKSLFGKAKALGKIRDKVQLFPGDMVMIGDEIRDLDAAKEAGIDCIGVGWGFNSEESLAKAGATLTVSQPGDLLKTLVAEPRR